MTFTSSSTVRNFASLVNDVSADSSSLFEGLSCYSIGPITSAAAFDEGFSIAAEAKEYTIPGLVEAIVEHRAACSEGK